MYKIALTKMKKMSWYHWIIDQSLGLGHETMVHSASMSYYVVIKVPGHLLKEIYHKKYLMEW